MSSGNSSEEVRVRKNILTLTPEEIENLRKAFQLLYEDEQYQRFAGILINYGQTDQNDLLFLPWARAYFNEFELLLRTKVDSVTLPYWDYTGDVAHKQGLPEIVSNPETAEGNPNPLYRALWTQPLYTFRTPGDPKLLAETTKLAEEAFAFSDFVDFSTNIWRTDIVTHLWIGGSSRSTGTTAFDPIFWFSHCNLDRFWDTWQKQYDDYSAPSSVLSAKLKPFKSGTLPDKTDLTGAEVMRTTDLGYEYK